MEYRILINSSFPLGISIINGLYFLIFVLPYFIQKMYYMKIKFTSEE